MAKYGDGWLNLGRWVAKLIAISEHACCGGSLGSNPDISQKSYIGDIIQGVANTCYSVKKYTKKEKKEKMKGLFV
jgi:hypothetical protein